MINAKTARNVICLCLTVIILPSLSLAVEKKARLDPRLALKRIIERDEKILSAPMNRVRTRQTRKLLREGLAELEAIISGVKARLGSDNEIVIGLEKILSAERKESAVFVTTHRYRRGLQSLVRSNLKKKKELLEKMREANL